MTLAVAHSGAGADLVLIHGWGMNAAVWREWLPHLEPHWRVHRVDLPGHGASPWSGETSLDEWCAAVADSVPEGALWLGWSLGGQLALEAARRGWARAVVAVAANPRFVQAPDWPWAMELGVLDRFAAELRTDLDATVRRFLALQVQGGAAAGATLRRLRRALAQAGVARPEALEAGLELLKTVDLRPALPQIEVPLVWILGGRDRLVPPALAPALARLRPDDAVHLLPEAGHAPFLSHAMAMAALMEGMA